MNARRLRRLAADAARLFAQHDLLTYSSAIAFQVLYAVVPLALLALAGLSLAGERSIYVRHIAPTLHRRLSADAFAIANRTALKVMSGERFWWLTLGLIVTLWGVGAALRSMMTPLNGVYGARETRSWRRRLLSSLGGGAIVVMCIFAAIVVVLGGRLVHPHGLLSVGFFPAALARGTRIAADGDRNAAAVRAGDEAAACLDQRGLGAVDRVLDRGDARLQRVHQHDLVLVVLRRARQRDPPADLPARLGDRPPARCRRRLAPSRRGQPDPAWKRDRQTPARSSPYTD
jgi:hypothetical protein